MKAFFGVVLLIIGGLLALTAGGCGVMVVQLLFSRDTAGAALPFLLLTLLGLGLGIGLIYVGLRQLKK